MGDLSGDDVEVGVEADTSDAQGEIDSIEPAPVEVPVTADTKEAQQSLDDLAGTIDAARAPAPTCRPRATRPPR